MSDNTPRPDPIEALTALAAAAAQLHEMFISLQEAGFTAEQALYLVGQSLRRSEAA